MTFDDPRLVEARALWTMLDGIDGKTSAEQIQWADDVLTAVHRNMLLDIEAKLSAMKAQIDNLTPNPTKEP